MEQGWIKIHKSVFESGFWQDSEAVHLWVHLLLKASYKQTKTIFNGKWIMLEPGQLITGRKKLSQETGISEKSIRRILNLFEMGQQIGQQKTPSGTCISILNWQKYQEKGQPTGQQRANEGPAEGQQRATIIEEYKEDKEIKNKVVSRFTPPTLDLVLEYFAQLNQPNIEAEKFHDYYTANGWKVGKNPMKDWKAACRNWTKNLKKYNQPNEKKNRKHIAAVPAERA